MRAHTVLRLRGDRRVCLLAQHRLRGVAEVMAVRVRVIAWVERSDRPTTLPTGEGRGAIDLHDDRHARGITCAAVPVLGCLTELLHGPVNRDARRGTAHGRQRSPKVVPARLRPWAEVARG